MLLVVFGPPAVGKMTIGRAICGRTGFRLFHNHMTIEPLLETFGFGTPAFNQLNGEFRLRVLQEAAKHGLHLAAPLLGSLPHLVVETDQRSADESADAVIDWLHSEARTRSWLDAAG